MNMANSELDEGSTVLRTRIGSNVVSIACIDNGIEDCYD